MQRLRRLLSGGFGKPLCVTELPALLREKTYLYRAVITLLALPLFIPFGYALGAFIWRLTSQSIIADLFSPIFLKTLFFQGVVEIAFVLYIALISREKKYSPFLTFTHALLLGFGVVLVVSSLFSLDANASFFGSARRGDGVFFLLHVGLYVFLLSWTVRSRRALEVLFGIALLGGFMTIFFIVAAIFISGPGALLIYQVWYILLEGILGNLNFTAHYFLILFLLGVYFVLQKPTLQRLGVPTIFLLAIVITSSNTPIILAGGLFIVLLAWIFRWLFYGVLLVGFSTVLYLASTGDALFVRWQSLRDSMHIRILLWHDAIITIFSSRPWFGHGWGNNELVWNFAHSDTPAQFSTALTHLFADRMHNVLLELLSATGIIGLLVVLVILGNIFWRLLRTFIVKREASTLFFLVSFAVQLIYLMLNFDTLMSYILVGLLLTGFVTFYEVRTRSLTMQNSIGRVMLIVAGVLGVPVIFYTNIMPFTVFVHKMRADAKITEASTYVNPSVKVKGIIEELDFAFSIKQPYLSLWRDIGTSFYNLSDVVSLTADERLQVYRIMNTLYQELLANSPMSVSAYHNLAHTEFKFAQDFQKAQEYIKKAVQLAPYSGLLRLQLGLLYLNNNDSELAEEVFAQLLRDGIYVGPANFYLGFIDFQVGHMREGKRKVITALSSYQPRDSELDHLATSFLTHASKSDLLVWYQRVNGLLKSPSQYVDKKILQLAKELGYDDLVQFYAKKLK